MDEINIKQLTLAVRTIAEEKNLPEETVLSIIEQAFRRPAGRLFS